MFLVTFLLDKLGYMPKVSVESTWPFPATAKRYTPHEFEQPIKKTVKVPKATTRKTATKKTVKKK